MRYQAEDGNISIALTGETMLARPLSVFGEEDYLGLRELLRNADIGFTNAEGLFHNYEDAPAYWAGTYMRTDPRLLADLSWLGINLMSCANNHAYDFGENGVLTNLRYLEQSGIAHAGTGPNMATASAPTYVETANGRVALVSATSSDRNAIAVRAGDQRADFRGRPGANVIDFTNEWLVDEAAFAALQQVSRGLGWDAAVRRTAANGYIKALADSDELVHFLDQTASEASSARFVRSDRFGKRSFIDDADLARNLRQVKEARRMADWVIFSMHHHEYGARSTDIADHIQVLAHAVVDAGADVFVGHGPHEDRGIEIYKGKPILYSLGDFIMQNDTVTPQPQRSYDLVHLGAGSTPSDFFDARSANGTRGQAVDPAKWESVVGVVTFAAGQLASVILHPVDLGFGRPRWQQGRPVLARGEVARSAVERIARLSEPFGTRLDFDGGLGMVRLDDAA